MQTTTTVKLSIAMTVALISLPVQMPLAFDDVQADKHRIFESAPQPEELADILFPLRYRDAKPVQPDSGEEPIFGMMINFEFDSTSILPDSEPMLQSLGEMMGMEQTAGRSIVVEGHTDATGSESYNQNLSERRAKAIKQYLVTKYGVPPKRLIAVGKGERQPASKDDPTASINRRATFRPAKKLVLK